MAGETKVGRVVFGNDRVASPYDLEGLTGVESKPRRSAIGWARLTHDGLRDEVGILRAEVDQLKLELATLKAQLAQTKRGHRPAGW